MYSLHVPWYRQTLDVLLKPFVSKQVSLEDVLWEHIISALYSAVFSLFLVRLA